MCWFDRVSLSNCFSVAVIAVVSAVSTLAAHAPSQLREVRTREGILSVSVDKGNDSNSCLVLNGKKISCDMEVFIDAVYPSINDAELVSVSLGNGGTCCPPVPMILDFTVKPHLSVKGIGFGGDIARSERGVVFTQYGVDSNEFGDPMIGVYEYKLGSGKAVLGKKTADYNLKPLGQKENAYEVLGDPVVRAPIVELLGSKEFADFRRFVTVSVSGDLKIINDSVIVASGCMPHNCDFSFGMFIIDSKRKLAWAVEVEGSSNVPSARLWGVIGKKDKLVASEISKWL